MLKRTVIRLLLFGIPFALSYWATRPSASAPPSPGKPFIVCAYPGDQPGELRFSLDTGPCRERGVTKDEETRERARTIPARRSLSHEPKDAPVTLPF